MRSYSEALKADKQLGSYISQRKKLQEQGFDKTSDAYKTIQNKINAAYGVSKRYELSDAGKRAQAAVSGGSKTLSTPSPSTTNVNRSTGGGTTGNTLMNRSNARPASPDPKMTSAPGALPTIKKGESMSAAVGSKDNTMVTVSKAEGGSRAYKDPNPGQPMIKSSSEVIPSKGMDFAAMDASAKASYASKKPSSRQERRFDKQVAKLENQGEKQKLKQAKKAVRKGEYAENAARDAGIALDATTKGSTYNKLLGSRAYAKNKARQEGTTVRKSKKNFVEGYNKSQEAANNPGRLKLSITGKIKETTSKASKIAEKSKNFGVKVKAKNIKVGAERDIHGNIVQGGRPAGTYERKKTVYIDPTSGKKVKSKSYKRIT